MAANGEVVIDASVVLAWLAPDEVVIGEVNRMLELSAQGKFGFTAPELLKYEVWNSLKTLVDRKRLAVEKLPEAIEKFETLRIKFVIHQDGEEVVKTAIKENLSGYDAAYVVLARKTKTKLLSLDKKLIRLAQE
jgi:predicted nucleic acid-binding protein